jgi:thiamine-phosphate pyrophosphorylase
MRGLYAIVDIDALERRGGLEPIRFAEALLAASPCALQLRAKNATMDRTLELLRALKPACNAARVPLVANDRFDLALVSGADMVHLGQEDASPSLVRAVAPKLSLGLSTHTPEQLNSALQAHPTYVAFGPVWSTTSKALPDAVVGVSGVKQASRLLRHHARDSGLAPPLVAIGGVTLERVAEIASYVAAAAVISDLLPPSDLSGSDAYDYVTARAQQFNLAFVDPVRLSSPSLDPPEAGERKDKSIP